MVIYWDDLDQIDEPGFVTLGETRVQVNQIHIDAWKEDPDGIWVLSKVGQAGPAQWTLASFYPSDDGW